MGIGRVLMGFLTSLFTLLRVSAAAFCSIAPMACYLLEFADTVKAPNGPIVSASGGESSINKPTGRRNSEAVASIKMSFLERKNSLG